MSPTPKEIIDALNEIADARDADAGRRIIALPDAPAYDRTALAIERRARRFRELVWQIADEINPA